MSVIRHGLLTYVLAASLRSTAKVSLNVYTKETSRLVRWRMHIAIIPSISAVSISITLQNLRNRINTNKASAQHKNFPIAHRTEHIAWRLCVWSACCCQRQTLSTSRLYLTSDTCPVFRSVLLQYVKKLNTWFQAYAAMLMKSVVFWVITRRRVVIIYRRFGTTYRSHLHGSRFQEEFLLESWTGFQIKYWLTLKLLC
jgi:hypothetical protein